MKVGDKVYVSLGVADYTVGTIYEINKFSVASIFFDLPNGKREWISGYQESQLLILGPVGKVLFS